MKIKALVGFFLAPALGTLFDMQSGAADGYWDARFGPGAEGVHGGLNAVAVSGTNVYIGGLFDRVGSINATNIARWDGTGWSALGGGVNNQVFAITVHGSDVYAGGKFTQAGSVGVNFVAKWNGSTWSPLGTGLNNGVGGYVYTLAARAEGPVAVYVGGPFGSAIKSDGTTLTVNNIARWDGSTWSALGTGVNGSVYGITVSGSEVFAGGNFTAAGSVSAAHVAKWNGSWSPLTNLFGQNGVNGYVNSIAVSGNTVYVGGNFTAAAGTSGFTNIALYDASVPRWRMVGNGVNNIVVTTAANGPNVYVGGYFTQAGGTNANHMARWDGTNWSPLNSGLNGTVEDLEWSNDQIYASGGFSTAGGKPSENFAIWHETSILQPEILDIHFSKADCLIRFSTQTGRQYYADRCDNLETTNWVAFTNLVSEVSGSIAITDPKAIVNATNRFYRIRSPSD